MSVTLSIGTPRHFIALQNLIAVGASRTSSKLIDQSRLASTTFADQGRGISREDLDQVGLANGAGFDEQAAEVGLDRGFGDAERRGQFQNAADLDDGEQHA